MQLTISDFTPSLTPAGAPFRVKGYTLFERVINLKGGRTQSIYFFAKGRPMSGEPCPLPTEYEVIETTRTGLPLLRRVKEARIC